MYCPFFTVVVVSRNAGEKIKETLDSVLKQSCADYEVVVKDCLSQDNTISFIPDDYSIHVYSENDSSVYDGMNQAINHCVGKYLIFMNCGDLFANEDILKKTKEFILEYIPNDEAIIYGDYIKDNKLFKQASRINTTKIVKEGLCHQTVFFHKNLFKSYGNYDIEMKICADYEFLARLYVAKVSFYHLPFAVCRYQGGGISEQKDNLPLVRKEGNTIRQRYFPLWLRVQYHFYRCIRNIQRRFSSK